MPRPPKRPARTRGDHRGWRDADRRVRRRRGSRTRPALWTCCCPTRRSGCCAGSGPRSSSLRFAAGPGPQAGHGRAARRVPGRRAGRDRGRPLGHRPGPQGPPVRRPGLDEQPAAGPHRAGLPGRRGTAEALLDDAELDWRDDERLRFVLTNLIDAAAPSNNPLISPVAWKAAHRHRRPVSVLRGAARAASDLSVSAAGALHGAAGRVRGRPRPRGHAGSSRAATEICELIHYAPVTPACTRIRWS